MTFTLIPIVQTIIIVPKLSTRGLQWLLEHKIVYKMAVVTSKVQHTVDYCTWLATLTPSDIHYYQQPAKHACQMQRTIMAYSKLQSAT